MVRATRRGIRPGVAGVAAVRSAARARERGVEVFQRVAEHLPFADDSFDDALVTTLGICTIRRIADWGQRNAPAYYRGKSTNVKLSDFAGKWVMLCLYPGDFTFV